MLGMPAQEEEAPLDDVDLSYLVDVDWWVQTVGPRLLQIVIVIVMTVVIRALLIRAVDKVVNRVADLHSNRETDTSRAAILAARKAQRTKTLGSLFKNIVNVVVLGLAGLILLAEIGINLGPLIAGAGVAGVAIGFGAKSLVQDFISGIFILMEDQYGVGDVVDLGDAIGTVEEVQLRVTKLRSIDGTLWFVRNGEIIRVGNMSQDYSKVVLDVAVSYDTDVERAKEVLIEVAREFATDPQTEALVLEEPEVLGVQALAPDSVQIRVVLTTPPADHWAASRVLRERIKAAFDANGIEIPLPQQVMWMRQYPQQPDAPAPAAQTD